MVTEKALPARMRAAGKAARLTLALLLLLLPILSGCTSTMYLLQAANGEWHVIHGRKPIVEVIDDPQTPELLVRELAEVRQARDFASHVLALPDNDSYRTYVEIDRPFVVWNVVAAPALSVQPKEWCFPIAGCVAYRGYFKEKRAVAFATALRQRGYDVVIEGVPAYSTLGKLPDPVMSTMMRYGSDELASTIFHELAHQLLYVRNDSRFDEAFAVTVEEEGLKRWLEYKDRPARIAQLQRQRAEEQQFILLLRQTRERLAEIYAADAPRAAKLSAKQRVFTQLAADIRALEHRLAVRFPLYDQWIADGLNNAELVSVGTYNDCVPGFERLLRQQDDDLPRFYAAARRLSRQPRAERDAQLCSNAAALTTTAADPAARTRPAPHHIAASAPSP